MRRRSFWHELKRRHVYRVAVAYVVVGWLLIQVVTQVFPVFHLPDWIDQTIVLLILIGFPIALVLAWAFDATPQGMIRTHAVPDATDAGAVSPSRSRRAGIAVGLIGVLIALIAGSAYWYFGLGSNTAIRQRPAVSVPIATGTQSTASQRASATPQTPAAKTPVIATQSIPAKSIAVLPFESLSTDKGNAYFADGMQDLILTKLAGIGDLKVISRTTTARYSSHPEDIKTVARQLGVASVLEGSVQKAGNQVLINVQLIDAASDQHLWAQSYTRTLDNIFGVEGEVAQKVADALNAKLSPSEAAAVAKVPTHNKQAYDAYLKGCYYLDDFARTMNPDENTRAMALLKIAVEADPNFANAYNALALVYMHQGGHLAQAEAAARHALALEPDNPDAHRMVAYVLARQGAFDQAIAQAQQAVHLAPKVAMLWNGLGNVYSWAGRLHDAETAYRHAMQLDPKEYVMRLNLAGVSEALRHYAAARDILRWVVSRDPENLNAATSLAVIYENGWGDLDAARKVLQAVATPVASSGALSDAWFWLYLYARDYPSALEVIDKAPAAWFTEQPLPALQYRALVYQAQGDHERANAAFAQVRKQFEDALKATPDGTESAAYLYAQLASALAGLGENAQAQSKARRAVALMPATRKVTIGAYILAQVEARTGDTAAAITHLQRLLQIPAGDLVSVSMLKLDPTWDPIRNDPRFQALLKKYATYEPAPAAADSAASSSTPGIAASTGMP